MESSFLFFTWRVFEKIFLQTTFHVLLQKSFFKHTPHRYRTGLLLSVQEADPFLIVLLFYVLQDISHPC
ncbi:hypothetical protein DXB71_00785 [Blautia sp. OM05-6]|nr:hypothetical protein DXB71_00785 [Blautia sp. OM05-6]